MDLLTLLGLITSFAAILIAETLEGGSLSSLLNLSALLIVLGGTIGAVMVQTPIPTFFRAIRILPWIIRPVHVDFQRGKDLLAELAKRARQLGLLSLEEHLEIEKNPLIKKGLELLVIGVDKVTIRQVLEVQIEHDEAQDMRAAQVYESMGGYSPTIGILGAVLGLIQVMRHLADPSSLGVGIAVAFVATIYGVGMANLLFLPIAQKLKSRIHRQVHFDEMIVEGMVAIANGESPNVLLLKIGEFGEHKKHVKKK